MSELPIEAILPALRQALAGKGSAVLQAPPGSGKTTGVPLALLDESWLAGRSILVLEPRRLATRAAARRMADSLGEPLGRTVGYRMRLDQKVGAATRIEVLTEGVFTRRLQGDPELEGVGLVIFDEVHERGLDTDLGLALTLDSRAALRPDLRLLAMSATLDEQRLPALLGGPLLQGGGRLHPVLTHYLPPAPRETLVGVVVRAVRRALAEGPGDVLVFVPGLAEIRQVQRALEGALAGAPAILALHGSLPQAQQDLALRPDPRGRRRLVISSALAESSLTVQGVGTVVDAGLARRADYDPRSGMSRLSTRRASRASADQRRGRAGRLGPGVCFRLWAESEQTGRPATEEPEVLTADLSQLALELAAWGVGDPGQLAWLDPPSPARYGEALDRLRDLQALDSAGRITAHGQALVRLGLHPRLGHMLLRAVELGCPGTGCWLAALLGESQAWRPPDGGAVDLAELLAGLAQDREPDRRSRTRLRQAAAQLHRRLGLRPGEPVADRCGALLSLAYPDRIAQRRDGARHRYRMRNGRGARLAVTDALAGADFLAVAELDGGGSEARIFSAAALSAAELREVHGAALVEAPTLQWDRQGECVVAERQLRLGALVIERRPWPDADPRRVMQLLADAIRERGLECLPWSPGLRQWRARAVLLGGLGLTAAPVPDFGDEALLAELETWLGPWLLGSTRIDRIGPQALEQALRARLDRDQQQALERLLPERYEVPSGARLRLDYLQGEAPVLAVKVQEMFGAAESPRLVDGRLGVRLHLLSPAGRPVQVTEDLAGFWHGAYAQVRKELRGRYPKHDWPEDPLNAPPARGARRGRSK